MFKFCFEMVLPNWRVPLLAVSLTVVGALLATDVVWSQARIIHLKNPSFEGIPQQGMYARFNLSGWIDCGFSQETPPDVHGSNTNYFDVNKKPFHGNTFLGMVVRSTNTWERVSQRLEAPLLKGQCYKFTIYLARASRYVSGINEDRLQRYRNRARLKEVRRTFGRAEYDFTNPVILRIWGGNGYCVQKELLAESQPIINTDWKKYEFYFKPKFNHQYIELEAFYELPLIQFYNGNVLLDNASDIVPVPCPEEELLYTSTVKDPDYNEAQQRYRQQREEKRRAKTPSVAKTPPPKPRKPKPKPPANKKQDDPSAPLAQTSPQEEPQNLRKLRKKDLKRGQRIRIKRLFFKADSATITPESEAVLDDLYHFLRNNPTVRIEIGGHTNGRPPHAYCDSLSTARAKAVYDYLVRRGIDPSRLSYKGYGKRMPIAPNTTPEGRRKNQRVEIKIIDL